jgi:predicted dehydrogenase
VSDLRFGHIGLGGASRGHAAIVNGDAGSTIVAVCDPSAEAQESFVTALGEGGSSAKRYTDCTEMLAAEELDAVVIATPHTQHAEQIRTCLDAGIHVMVEKPMATTARDARDLIEASESAGKVLAIAYQRHGDGEFIKARELIQSGAIGDVRLIHVLIAQNCLSIFETGATWRADPELSGGGHFMDTGSHINDMMLWISGLEPKRVQAFISNEGNLVDVNTSLTVEFTNGAVACMSYTSLAPEWREEFRFYGPDGMIRIGKGEPLLLCQHNRDQVLPRPAGNGQRPADNFLAAIRGEAEVQAPPICGLRVAQLTEAAYASAASGKPHHVG